MTLLKQFSRHRFPRPTPCSLFFLRMGGHRGESMQPEVSCHSATGWRGFAGSEPVFRFSGRARRTIRRWPDHWGAEAVWIREMTLLKQFSRHRFPRPTPCSLFFLRMGGHRGESMQAKPGIVWRSCVKRIRPSNATRSRISGSAAADRRIAPARRRSIAGSRRTNPRTIRPLKF